MKRQIAGRRVRKSPMHHRRCRLERLEDRRLLAAEILFADSFESGSNSNDWAGNWVEDSQNDWFRSTQRASDGVRSAEVDGSANNATLTMASPIDLTSYSDVELTFDWYIESGFDSGEYLAVDLYDGSSWSELARLRGNVDAENTWHSESIAVSSSYLTSNFQVRFRSKVSGSSEDANVDNVKVTGTLPSTPEISIGDVTTQEGGTAWEFAEAFESDEEIVNYATWDIAQDDDGNLFAVTSLNDVSGIMRIDGQTGEVTSEFVSLGTAGLNKAREITIRDSWMYVANKTTNEVLRFDVHSGTPDPAGPFIDLSDQGLQTPRGLTFDDQGNLFVISKDTNAIVRYDENGDFLGTFAANVTSTSTPNDLTIHPVSGDVLVTGDGKVLRYSSSGTFLGVFADAGSDITSSIEFGPEGDLYVGNGLDGGILRFDDSSGFLKEVIANDSFGEKQGMVFDNAGSLYVGNHPPDTSRARVLRYSSNSSATFSVTLSSPSSQTVSVDYSTINGTASAGSDYDATSGTLVFAPGETSQMITVPIIDDSTAEVAENFFVNLSLAFGANVVDGQGEGTIAASDLVTTISYPDFSDPSKLNLIADATAAFGGENVLRIVPDLLQSRGAAWHTEPQVVATAFETEFEFQAGPGGGQGFAFVVQNESPWSIGMFTSPGYARITNSVAIEFDTLQQTDRDDPDDNHIAIQTKGVELNAEDASAALATFTPSFDINDGQVHHVRVSYEPGVMSVFLDYESMPALTAALDLAALLNLDAGHAWLGFTAATTGSAAQTVDVLDWSFSRVSEASTWIEVGDTQLVEGNSGASDMLFTVTRGGDLSDVASGNWTTSDNSATFVDNDYLADSGQIVFAPGEAEKTISVVVNGDGFEESHETFFVNLSSATGAFIVNSVASGTILNDDTTISIAGASGLEGSQSMAFLGEFASGSLTSNSRGIEFGPDGNLYVNEGWEQTGVLRFDGETGAPLGVFAETGPIVMAKDIEFGPDGNLYVADGVQSRIGRFDGATGEFIDVFVDSHAGGLHTPRGLTFGQDGDLYVTSGITDEIMRFDGSSGAFVETFVTAGSGGLVSPQAVLFHEGYFYVSSGPYATASILRYDGSTGAFVDAFVPAGSAGLTVVVDGGLLFGPDMNGDGAQDLWASSGSSDEVMVFDGATGDFLQTVASHESSPLDGPAGLAYGVDENLYVLSVGRRAILRYGAASQAAFTVSLSSPSGVAVSVDFSTADISTSTGVDYVAQSGTVVFEPGMTTRTILVQTLDDSDAETTESFVVNLSNASGATLIDGEALGQIIDDDSNSDPVAVADSSTADSEVEQVINVLANDSDSDGDPLVVDSVGPTSGGGAVVINGDNTISYTSAPGFSGIESFDYTISDGRGGTATATVSVDVSAVVTNVVYVADIRFESRYWGWQNRAVFEIRSDSNGDGQGSGADQVAAGVQITVQFGGQTYSGVTDSNGIFRTSWIWSPGSGSYANVVDLALADYEWNPLALDLEDDSDGDGRPDNGL